MDNTRTDPAQILKQLQNEEKKRTKGTLKIFFGYAAGVGKTYGMLEDAHDEMEKGVDVVAGYIEPHARPETAALLRGMEMLPTKSVHHNGMNLREFDLDAAIKRNPDLILVDELAHTNAPDSRNMKRYQDVEELLKAGINVYTTINVQHIESLHDIVSSITGISVKERIPDSVFDSADRVEIIDIEPKDLLERLNEGKVYGKIQARRAMNNFFTTENLTALREIALRKCADQVNTTSIKSGIKQHTDYQTEEKILVCLSSSPSNTRIIRTASRMAKAFKGTFTALYVETPDSAVMSEENKNRLKENMRLAEQLGAKIEIIYGEDIPYQIAEFARLSGITKVVIGRSSAMTGRFFSKQTLVEKLIMYGSSLDIHIIPDYTENTVYHKKKLRPKPAEILSDFTFTILILVISTIIGKIFARMDFEEANIIMVYVLGVLITSVITKRRIFSLISSVVSVLIFNFVFTYPYLSFHAYGSGYPVTFAIMFLSALITSSLAARLKNHAKQSAVTAYRTKILLDTSQSLQQADNRNDIMDITANQILKLLKKDVITYNVNGGRLESPVIHFVNGQDHPNEYLSHNEQAVATWVMKNNKHAGATTQTLSESLCLYLAVRVNTNVYGVIGIAVGKSALEAFEKIILLSILGECALALENEKNAIAKEEAAVLAKNEQLRANLLRSISHDLRTPLTSISGNASNFLSNGDSLDEETKKQLFTDIYDDSMWLINLVENLLAVTRLEDSSICINTTSELVEDIIDEALSHISRKKSEHHITVSYDNEFTLIKADPRLLVQVIINLTNNAIKYTPAGSHINISVTTEDKMAVISVSDDGPGIPDEMKPRIFDRFYCGSNKIADSRRSLGLGLSLCKSIINAHGGKITVLDNQPQGTIFRFTLPIGEVTIHE